MATPGNIAEYREAARRRLPAPLFHYIDGGAEDEHALRRNSAAFSQWCFDPKVLVDVTQIKLDGYLLGRPVSLPFFLSPTGMSRLFHIQKELGAARAAAQRNIFYGLSTLATTSLESVAAATSGPKLFQIYIFKDRGLTRELIARCKQSGYDAICLTVDTAMAGNRERDRRTGMMMPPRFGLKSLWSFATHPRWALDFMRDPDFGLANIMHRAECPPGGALSMINYVNSQFDRSVTWEDASWLANEWGGPFVVKGVMNTADAMRARDHGATALMISNHGGRQLDQVRAPIEMIEPIRSAVGPAMELIVDGGVRRGSDIVKALSLGANACSIGRPYLYGLATGGERGVTGVIDLLKTEIERTMTLLGCSAIEALQPSCLIRQ